MHSILTSSNTQKNKLTSNITSSLSSIFSIPISTTITETQEEKMHTNTAKTDYTTMKEATEKGMESRDNDGR